MIQMALGEIPEDEAYKILKKLITCSGQGSRSSGQMVNDMMDNPQMRNQMMDNQMQGNNDPNNQAPSGLMGSLAAFGQPQQSSQSTIAPNPEALNAVKQFAASGQLTQLKGIADTFLGKDTRKNLQGFASNQIQNRLGPGAANAVAQFKQAASTKPAAPAPAPAPAPAAPQSGGRRTRKSKTRSKSKSKSKSKTRSRKNRRSRRS